MGRWTFPEGGEPLYVPDAGEGAGGGGGLLGHLGMGIGRTFEDMMGSAPARLAGQALGAPGRAVTAVGHSMDPAGYQGKTDPIDYIMTGEKEDPADLAGYGDLLADTMEAEGTVKEGSAASKIVRTAGAAVSDPLILAGVARLAVKPAGAAPRMRTGTRKLGDAPKGRSEPSGTHRMPDGSAMKDSAMPKGRATRYRQPPADRPSPASQWPSVPLDRDIAAPGAFTRGGVGKFPGGKAPKKAGPYGGGPPLDTDLVSAKPGQRGGVGSFPAQMGKASRRGKATRKATGDMRAEQLGEGVEAMGREFGPQPLPAPANQLRGLIQAAVENGASADDIMQLLANLGG